MCPVCQSENLAAPMFGQPVYRCNECGHLFRSRQYIDRFEYSFYKDNSYWYDDPQYYLRQKMWLALFDEWITRRGSCIEFGAGTGELISQIADAGWTSRLIYSEIEDLCQSGIQCERNIGLVEDILPEIQDCSLDHIFMFDVIEHTKKPFEVLRGIARTLSASGRAYIITTNGNSKYSDDEMFYHLEHFHIWSKESWSKTLEQCGLHQEMFYQDGIFLYSVVSAP